MSTAGAEGSDRLDLPSLSGKSTAELSGELARHVTSLVHHEIELARHELVAKGRRAGLGGGLLGTAGGVGLIGLGTLTACAVAAIHLVLSVWLSALIVGGFLGVVAAFFALLGGSELRRATPAPPTESIEQAKEDVAWIRTHAKSGKR